MNWTVITEWIGATNYGYIVSGTAITSLLIIVWLGQMPWRVSTRRTWKHTDTFSAAVSRQRYYRDPQATARQQRFVNWRYAYTEQMQRVTWGLELLHGRRWSVPDHTTLPERAARLFGGIGALLLVCVALYFLPGVVHHKPVQTVVSKERVIFYLDEERRAWLKDAEFVRDGFFDGFFGMDNWMTAGSEWVHNKVDEINRDTIMPMQKRMRDMPQEVQDATAEIQNFFGGMGMDIQGRWRDLIEQPRRTILEWMDRFKK